MYQGLGEMEDDLYRYNFQNKELPKIGRSLEVLAGIKSKKLAKLECRLEMLEERIYWVEQSSDKQTIEDNQEFYDERAKVRAEVDKLSKKMALGGEE